MTLPEVGWFNDLLILDMGDTEEWGENYLEEKKETKELTEHEYGHKREDDHALIDDGIKDIVESKFLKIKSNVGFLETPVFVVEVTVKDHDKTEVIADKENEIKNFETYKIFE